MAADWQAVENTLQAWAVRASGLPDPKVVWDGQSGARPKAPFVTLHRTGAHDLAPLPEIVVSDNPDATPGAEILIDTIAQAEFLLTVQVFTVPTVGPQAAQAIAQSMRNRLGAESEFAYFDGAGLAIVETGTVQNLTGVLDTEFEGRASFEVRLRIADGFEESATYIETVETTGTIE